jgi:hypothetical protein
MSETLKMSICNYLKTHGFVSIGDKYARCRSVGELQTMDVIQAGDIEKIHNRPQADNLANIVEQRMRISTGPDNTTMVSTPDGKLFSTFESFIDGFQTLLIKSDVLFAFYGINNNLMVTLKNQPTPQIPNDVTTL